MTKTEAICAIVISQNSLNRFFRICAVKCTQQSRFQWGKVCNYAKPRLRHVCCSSSFPSWCERHHQILVPTPSPEQLSSDDNKQNHYRQIQIPIKLTMDRLQNPNCFLVTKLLFGVQMLAIVVLDHRLVDFCYYHCFRSALNQAPTFAGSTGCLWCVGHPMISILNYQNRKHEFSPHMQRVVRLFFFMIRTLKHHCS